MSANSYPGLKPDGRAGLGRAFDAKLDAMASQLTRTDQAQSSGARMSCQSLLRAQLAAGQHVLALADARILGLSAGLHPADVRPGIGDPTAFKLRSAR